MSEVNGKVKAGGKLDVEDEEARQARIEELLQKVNASSGSSTSRPGVSGLLSGPGERPHAVEPPSELLSRVQAFLPELAASNAELETRAREDPGSVDIENVNPEAGQYIEMNLGLGVFEQRRCRRPSSSSSSSLSSLSSSSNSTLDPGESSSDSDQGEEDEGEDEESDADACSEDGVSTGRIPARPRPTRPLPRRARIVELGAQRASSLPPQ